MIGLAALSGATGFLGRRLAPAMLARGWRVRALTRGALPAPAPGEALTWERGDLADHAALARLTHGADVTIHCAGLIKANSRAEFFAVNEGGAAAVAAAAPGRLILVSSLAARAPELSDYAASKRAGEAAALREAGGRATIVRPPAIYGPGDRETLGLFRLASRSPVLPLPGDDDARLALAHVDDVVAAILRLAEGEAAGGCFAIGGDRPEGYGWREIMSEAARACGRRTRLAPIPPAVVMGAATLSAWLGRLSGAPAIFTPGKARELLHGDWSVTPMEQAPDAPAARFSLKAGFADAVDWYRGEGWLAKN